MPLVSLQAVDYGVGGPLLLDGVDVSVDAGERVALIGRNGAGKSTLLKLLDGTLRPDDGVVRLEGGARVARLEQEVPAAAVGDVWDVVAGGLGDIGAWLAEYHHLSDAAEVDTAALADVQARIEAAGGWSLDQRVGETLQRLGLDGDAPFAALSGGLKRRVLLARALVSAPDVLLLDEPTNHLDIAAIEWLEGLLRAWPGALVFVTHDRRFLRALATRIVEVDRGRVTSWPGDWANYLRRREERLNAEAQEAARFDKLLAQEEAWIRQGIKARRTRDEGRVRRLETMRLERGQRREQSGNVRMEAAQGAASGRKVVEAKEVGFAFDGTPLVRDFSTTILRGDRIGLVGPNGSGKTTLLRLLLGELAPTSGSVRLGTNLEVAYFDQQRAALRKDWNALENVAGGRESVTINGRQKHVVGYLQDFLFTPERARAPITRLSGGERNRLLLARLFAAVEPAGHGRTDQRPGRGDARAARRAAGRLRRHAAAGQPRPRLPGQRGHVHAGDGRRRAGGGIRRWLQRLGASAGRRGRATAAGAHHDATHASARSHALGSGARSVAPQAQLQGRAGTRAATGPDRIAGGAHRRDDRRDGGPRLVPARRRGDRCRQRRAG